MNEARLARAVEKLAESHRARGITSAEGQELPSTQAVSGLILDLESMLFPGYFPVRGMPERCTSDTLADCCVRIAQVVSTEVVRALRTAAPDEESRTNAESRAEEIALELIEALPQIRDVLYEDAQAALQGDPAARSLVEVILSYPTIRAIAAHRVAHFLHQRRVPLIPRMMSEQVHGRTGIDIHPGAQIGEGLFIDHGTGVVIGETAIIGKRCKLYQGVTLGALSVRKHDEVGWDPPKRHPTLEDGVTVYAHATILGGDTVIGQGSTIGGNVWLTRSVPKQTTVQIGAPNLVYRTGGAPTRMDLDYEI